MGTNITFTEQAFEEYLSWQGQDRKTLKRINALLKDICRSPFEGIGKPEPLKENLSGYWSRRIDDTNRLVYRMVDGQVEVYQCKGHYDDWVSEAVLPAASLFCCPVPLQIETALSNGNFVCWNRRVWKWSMAKKSEFLRLHKLQYLLQNKRFLMKIAAVWRKNIFMV